MKCKVCGNELKDGAKFCVKCGTKVEVKQDKVPSGEKNEHKCSVCGKELKPGAKFCSKCGAKVALSSGISADDIQKEKNNSQLSEEKVPAGSIKIPNVKDDTVNPFLLNGKSPCGSM